MRAYGAAVRFARFVGWAERLGFEARPMGVVFAGQIGREGAEMAARWRNTMPPDELRRRAEDALRGT